VSPDLTIVCYEAFRAKEHHTVRFSKRVDIRTADNIILTILELALGPRTSWSRSNHITPYSSHHLAMNFSLDELRIEQAKTHQFFLGGVIPGGP
jgi:hypothetical protein